MVAEAKRYGMGQSHRAFGWIRKETGREVQVDTWPASIIGSNHYISHFACPIEDSINFQLPWWVGVPLIKLF